MSEHPPPIKYAAAHNSQVYALLEYSLNQEIPCTYLSVDRTDIAGRMTDDGTARTVASKLISRASKSKLGEALMIGGLKIIHVKQGHEQEFESLFGELHAAMREHEPDCLLYSLLKSRSNPRYYVVHEQYRDQAALDAHQSSPHGKVYFPKIRAVLDSITVE